MPKTIVCCTMPGCREPATAKVAARWTYGSFTELKTFGFACPDHIAALVERAEGRIDPARLAPGEAMGRVGTFAIGAS